MLPDPPGCASGRIRSKIAQTFGTPDRTGRQDADRLANVVWCRAIRPQADRPVDFPHFSATGSPQPSEAAQEASMGTKLESLTIQTDSLWRVPSGQRESVGPAAGAAEGKVAQRSPDGQLKVSQEGLNWPKRLRHHGRLASPGNPASLGCHLGGEPAVVRFKFGAQDDWRRIGLTFWVQRKAYCTLERGVRVLVGREKPAPPEWNEYLERTVRSRAFRLRKPNPRERWRFSLEADGKPDWTREPWKSARARVEAQEQTRRRQRG
ncbi:MAG TPA: hypothetical protein VI455_07825 [Terriglobia bacterium]